MKISSKIRHQGISIIPGRVQAMIYAFGTGLLFVMVALLVSIIHEKLEITIANILLVHILNPVLFFLYTIPVFFVVSVYYILKTRERDLSVFDEEITKKDATINRNASLAQEIGKGNYNIRTDESKKRKGLFAIAKGRISK